MRNVVVEVHGVGALFLNFPKSESAARQKLVLRMPVFPMTCTSGGTAPMPLDASGPARTWRTMGTDTRGGATLISVRNASHDAVSSSGVAGGRTPCP